MKRGTFVSLALATGLLISAHAGKAHAAVGVPSLAQSAIHSVVEKIGDWEYCYWKLKKNGNGS
jgi:hypothetical protein